MSLRRCIDCSYVFKNFSSKSNRRVRCTSCQRKHRNKYKREQRKNDHYKAMRDTRKYRIKLEEVNNLRDIKSCQICGRESKLCIDHDHNSGHVRGVICYNCNKLMTALDVEGWLDKALIYLKR